VSKSEAFSSSLALLLAILLNVRLTNTALSTALRAIAMMYPSLEAFSLFSEGDALRVAAPVRAEAAREAR
jgi:hypothetical protein